MNETNIGHIVGTFLVSAHGAFLNGWGTDQTRTDKNYTRPKQFSDGKYSVPYVSAQAWRRWLRNTIIEETGWEQSQIRSAKTNARGNTSKAAGELNPIDFAEDDLFGYMFTRENTSGNENNGNNGKTKAKSLARASPFKSSILMSLRKNGWKGTDEAYVHLEEGTPIPYNTEFYNTHLQGLFGLDVNRVGLFRNKGDRIEVDYDLLEQALDDEKIEELDEGKLYKLSDEELKNKRVNALLKSLAVLRGGSKQASFATDVAPKVMVFAGLNCGNLILNEIFEDNHYASGYKGPSIRVETLKEIAMDYKDKLTTPIHIGIRKGYLNPDNEEMVRQLVGDKDLGALFVVDTPRGVVEQFTDDYFDPSEDN